MSSNTPLTKLMEGIQARKNARGFYVPEDINDLAEYAAELERARGADDPWQNYVPQYPQTERCNRCKRNVVLTASPPAQDSAAQSGHDVPASHSQERRDVGIALSEPSSAAGVEEPQRWSKADHHASCHPTDSSLVWQCGQCGHVAAADDVDAHIAGLTARLREMASPHTVTMLRGEIKAQRERAEAAERDRDAARELLSIHNLGGMTDYNDGPMKRALAAERDREALRKELLRLRDVVSDVDAEIIDAALSAREGGK